jgi:hypothetical protein
MRRVYHLSLMLVLATGVGCADGADVPMSPMRPAMASATVTSSGPVDVPVTTTVYDADTAGALLLTRSDDANGTGFATYSPISGVHIGLTSHVDSAGAWQLFIGGQSLRTLHLMLADAGLQFANGYYSSSVEMASRCFDDAGNTLNIQRLAAGASYGNCSLILDFDYGTKKKTTYKLAMGPKFADTGRAMVTCDAVAGGYCTSWTIVPNDAAPNARVAILTAGNGTITLDGKFYANSYRVAATK